MCNYERKQMNHFEVTVKHKIETQTISDVIDTGLSWSLDWHQRIFRNNADGKELPNLIIGEVEQGDWFEQLEAGTLELKHNPENGLHELTDERIQQGLAVLAEDYPTLMAEILNDNSDANTGDVLIQCALFGTEVYS